MLSPMITGSYDAKKEFSLTNDLVKKNPAKYCQHCYRLGMMHLEGRGTPKDEKEAFKWISLASENAVLTATVQMGIMLLFGIGCVRDLEAAKKYLTNPRVSQDRKAIYYRAIMFDRGLGEALDQHKATRLFRDAANEGHLEAKYVMGLRCLDGRGIDKDLQAAEDWFRAAAKEDHPESQFQLAEILSKQQEPRLHRQAKEWYLAAAKLNHTEAKIRLKNYEPNIPALRSCLHHPQANKTKPHKSVKFSLGAKRPREVIIEKKNPPKEPRIERR